MEILDSVHISRKYNRIFHETNESRKGIFTHIGFSNYSKANLLLYL